MTPIPALALLTEAAVRLNELSDMVDPPAQAIDAAFAKEDFAWHSLAETGPATIGEALALLVWAHRQANHVASNVVSIDEASAANAIAAASIEKALAFLLAAASDADREALRPLLLRDFVFGSPVHRSASRRPGEVANAA